VGLLVEVWFVVVFVVFLSSVSLGFTSILSYILYSE